MEEENTTGEIKENLEKISENAKDWNMYLAVTTAIIAVLAAIASLLSGTFSNEAILEKNNAILYQNKASDQWSYYQAKGVKKNLAESFYEQFGNEKLKADVDRYTKEQEEIKKQADEFEKKVKESNINSFRQLEKHHKSALAVTFFQIAIALSAISALLKRKSFWYISILLAAIGLGFFLIGLR